MKKSRYFSDLISNYNVEIDDLLTDSEGKAVLQKRLNQKRKEIEAILPMIEFSPEMVSVVFYGAFGFSSPKNMQQMVASEPWFPGFPTWSALRKELTVADWAEPLIKATLKTDGGDDFLVATAGLEYLRTADSADASDYQSAKSSEDSDEDRDEDGDEDLSEAGADWMSEQGFDPLER